MIIEVPLLIPSSNFFLFKGILCLQKARSNVTEIFHSSTGTPARKLQLILQGLSSSVCII